MGESPAQFWGAVQTQTHKESLAEAHLTRQGYTCWCPRLMRSVKSGRRTTKRLKALFPGYIFVAIKPSQRWRPIDGTIGVLRLVKTGGAPAALPEGLVERLQANIDEAGGVLFDETFEQGDTVRVMSGAFDNWIGTVLSVPDSDRVTLLLEMIGRDVPVTLARSQLVKAA